jgi:hypothetical protein
MPDSDVTLERLGLPKDDRKVSIAVKKKVVSRSITHESGKSSHQIEMYGVQSEV